LVQASGIVSLGICLKLHYPIVFKYLLMSLARFQIFTPDEFADYIRNTQFSRQISVIQNHHTFRPGYQHLTADRGEMYWLESMRNAHIRDRKWSDIGQNITTFRSGKIGLCRPIDKTPAGIYGANTGAICIEHMGDFDSGKDQMTPEHRQTIIRLNAILCLKFGLNPLKWQVVYHHWYDTAGRKFQETAINSGATRGLQKSCPGTGFFGGNTIAAAEQHFFPLIASEMEALRSGNASRPPKRKWVNASLLNVRSGPGKDFPVVRKLSSGAEVHVYAEDPAEASNAGSDVQPASNAVQWCRISNTAEEWVSNKFLEDMI
jgi:hypothetical protein